MFGPAGFFYVYFTYGMHYCANIVAGREGIPGAVLLRGLDGIADAHGPARLCRALDIDLRLNGVDVTTGDCVWVERGRRGRGERIIQTTRIGITADVDLPWRFYLAGSPGVSRRDRAAEAALA
jgi:DNA-3-methyladenine glycosylase